MDNEPRISVAVVSESKVEFDLFGEFRIPDVNKKCSGSFSVIIENNKILLLQKGSQVYSSGSILFEPRDIDLTSFVIREVRIGKGFHWERKEKQRFYGTLKLIIEDNRITAINIIPVEAYLESVISSEMNANSPYEFLKAHAVVSRSWVLAQVEKKNRSAREKTESTTQTEEEYMRWYDREEHGNYDLCADDHCQRYQGVLKIINDKVLSAVEETRGLVLMHNDEICDARFSKCCGGISESFENVWEPVEHPYLIPVYDYKYEQDIFDSDLTEESKAKKWIKSFPQSFCNTSDSELLSTLLPSYDLETKNFYRWTVEYTQEEIAGLINKKSGFDFGEILDLVPVERGHSGRITKLKVIGSKKTMVMGKELHIRKILSETHLYSSAFVIEKHDVENNIPGSFTLYGAGWGHGVGLCQIGAAVMSSTGYRFDEILSHYYKNSIIHKIY
jgi:stage II sporulation protein D